MISEQNSYRIINLILAGVISLIFVYSGVFSYKKENHPIPSFHTLITGEKTLSTGLSRSFSAIVRLEYDIAHQYNPYGVRIFLFFLEQILLRFIIILLLNNWPQKLKTLIFVDVLFSTGLFIIHFKPFILDAFYR